MNKQQILIEFRDFSFEYPTSENLPALQNINLQIKAGNLTVLCGMSGSGKTTLLRHLKPELSPAGKKTGDLIFADSLREKNILYNRQKIAYVMQNPSNQIIMDSVWHELAFGLENQGLKVQEIERRIAEIAIFFGIETWIDKKVAELSGGEKQILNLASNMILQPDLLVLDEPTAQLDPIARRDFLQMLFYIHSETGISIVISEHNLNDLLENADHVFFLDEGKLDFSGSAIGLADYLFSNDHSYKTVLPLATQISYLSGINQITEKSLTRPLSIKQGRDLLKRALLYQSTKTLADDQQIDINDKIGIPGGEIKGFSDEIDVPDDAIKSSNLKSEQIEKILTVDRVWYRYNPDDDLVLKETSLNIYKNEIFVIMGGNGSGKSTLLYLMSRALKPFKGQIKSAEQRRIAMLGQNPEAVFAQDTVLQVLTEYKQRFANTEQEISDIIDLFDLRDLLQRHPYDLSGGEKQKLALAKVLLIKPDILLLDEPFKSLDVINKQKIKRILLELKQKMSIVIVTHDVDFISEIADRCAMIFNQRIIAQSATTDFFQKNSYFTTTTYRLTRDIIPGCIVFHDLQQKLRNLTNGELSDA
ncbi:MAG: ATP-binding cassette domain-containing protein [Clostridiaceae bacterium]|mgnify:CR=1 FL=1|nr:ATP-binding cassette domain-containing protein [Clostridiaceae bacterium]